MALIGSWSGLGAGRPSISRPAQWLAAWRRFADGIEYWQWQRRTRRDEAYLAQAASMEDLDRRMHDLDRKDGRMRFIGYF
jgi:hypothetical protein